MRSMTSVILLTIMVHSCERMSIRTLTSGLWMSTRRVLSILHQSVSSGLTLMPSIGQTLVFSFSEVLVTHLSAAMISSENPSAPSLSKVRSVSSTTLWSTPTIFSCSFPSPSRGAGARCSPCRTCRAGLCVLLLLSVLLFQVHSYFIQKKYLFHYGNIHKT